MTRTKKYGEETHLTGVRIPVSTRQNLLEHMPSSEIPSYIVAKLQEEPLELDDEKELLIEIIRQLNKSFMELVKHPAALKAAQTMFLELDKNAVTRFQELVG